MSLKIFIDGFQGQALATNQLVTGYVEVHYKKAEQRDMIRQILLNFYGRSKVRITRSESTSSSNGTTTSTYHYDSKSLLFTHHYTLENPTFSPPASRRGEDGGILTFPFSFRIPTHAEPIDPPTTEAHKAHILRPHGPFPGSLGYDPPGNVQPRLPLPDTVTGFWDRYDGKITAEADVRYTLNAQCPDLKAGASRLWMGNVDEQVDLPLVNPASLPPTQVPWKRLAHEEAIRSLRLLPSHQNNKLSFRENMRSVFKKDRLPWCQFRMTVQVPEILWLDRPDDLPLPVLLNVRRVSSGAGTERRKSDASATGPPSPQPPQAGLGYADDKNDLSPYPSTASGPEDDMPTPPLYLKSLELKYISYTAARGPDDRVSSYGGRTYEMIQTAPFFDWKADKKQPQIEVPVGTDVWFDLGRELGITWKDLRIVQDTSRFGGLQGQFCLANLIRSFGIEWDIKMEAADEDLRWETRAKYGGGIGMQVYRGDGAPPAVAPPMDGAAGAGGHHSRTPSANLAPPPMPYPHRGSTPVDPRMQYQQSPGPSPVPSPHLSPSKPLPTPPGHSPSGSWDQRMEAPPGYSPYDERPSAAELSGKMENLYVADPGYGTGSGSGSGSGNGNGSGSAYQENRYYANWQGDGGWEKGKY